MMIYIKIDDNRFYDDAIVLVRSFYPRTEVTAYKESDNSRNNPKDNHKDSTEENLKDTSVDIIDTIIDIKVPDVTGLNKSQMHDKFKSYLYDYLSKKTGKTLPWGYLTGVRHPHRQDQVLYPYLYYRSLLLLPYCIHSLSVLQYASCLSDQAFSDSSSVDLQKSL